MTRSLHTAVSVALLAVLAGAPLAAVFCAEWCATDSRRGQDHVSSTDSHARHHPAAAPEPQATMDCHGSPGSGPRVAGHVVPECLDTTLVSQATGPVSQRLDLASLHASVSVSADDLPSAHATTAGRGWMPTLAHASPPRPVSSSLVLRI